jgi:Ca2+-binding RTX toxin-like protein
MPAHRSGASLRRISLAVALAVAGTAAFAATASASSVARSGATISITAAAGELNGVDVRNDGAGNFVVSDSAGATPDSGCTPIDDTHVQCPASGVTQIGATLGDGNDTFQTVGPTEAHVFGGTGDDNLTGGSGNDALDGEDGQDNLVGGDGDDTLTGGLGSDTFDAGAGNDTLSGGSGDDGLDAGSGDDTIDGGADSDNVSGGDGTDTITTRDSSPDNVTCGAGADRVTADRLDTVDTTCEQIDKGTTTGGPGSGSGSGQSPDTTSPAVTISGKTVKAKGGVITVKVKCPASEVSCRGKVTLRTAGKVNGKVILLGSRSFKAAGGKIATVKIKLSAKNRKLLAKLGKLRVKATVVARDAAGNVKTKTKTFVVKAP